MPLVVAPPGEPPLTLVWPDELAFTRWLARHVDALAAVIGIPLESVSSGTRQGEGFADVIARRVNDGSLVVIENQFGPSDDPHLRQIEAYTAASGASTAVWIAPSFRDSHLRIVRDRNSHGPAPFSFYAVRLGLMRVGSSFAPTLEALAGPGGHREGPLQIAGSAAERRGSGFTLEFWSRFLNRRPDEAKLSRPAGPHCRLRRRLPGMFVVGLRVTEAAIWVFVGVRGPVARQVAWERLTPVEDLLEARLGAPLLGEQTSIFAEKRREIDTGDRRNWDAMADWLYAEANAYEAALRDLLPR